ncbi:MAG: ferritin family protein [Desulfosalsimonadaceae bacterium]
MKNGFTTFAEVIDFAVMREEESHDVYRTLAAKTDDPFLSPLFLGFAQEELKHKQMLLDIDTGGLNGLLEKIMEKQADLGLVQNFQKVTPGPEMAFQDALVFAMQREDKACRLYGFLAEISPDDDISLLFSGLAGEEARHQSRIEKTYKNLFG